MQRKQDSRTASKSFRLVMRHTACTRMAECRMDMKVLQYIMGHAHINVTMEVYNHLGDRERIENEIARLDKMAVDF